MLERLVTINIEGDKHKHRFIPVLQKLAPSIVCLQEIFEADCEEVAQSLDMKCYKYVPTMRIEKENKYGINPRGLWGICLMTNLEVLNWETFQYALFDELKVFKEPNDNNQSVIVAHLSDGNKEYCIATTHFTWSPGGEISELQRQHFENLIKILSQYDQLVLCGDFNAPRGREMFAMFEQHFKDNLPKEIKTTIDNTLHYAGHKNLELVVDTIFSTPGYKVTDVEVIDGVSDHLAVTALVEKVD